jgi:hypothetical protein
MARGVYDRAAARARREAALLEKLGVDPSALNSQSPMHPRPSDADMDKIDRDIRTTFRVLERITDGIVAGDIRGLLLTGQKGIGKTETIDRKLKAAEQAGTINRSNIGGSMSAIMLYRELYNFRNANNVLVLDDCDTIFFDQQALNLLKHALDTKHTRTLAWKKDSSVLRNEDIPDQFDYEGSIIFISNMDMLREINSNGKLAPHFDALVNRTTWIDTGIHTRWEVFVRIRQIVFSKEFMTEQRLDADAVEEMLDWIEDNIQHIQSLSIRTVVQLGRLIRLSPETWIEDAEITLLKKRR